MTGLPAGRRKTVHAFTLVEVVMALGIIGLVFGSIIIAYTQASKRAQWSGYQLAAQALAIQQVEQIRSARWDVYTGINEITNLQLNSFSLSGTTMTGYSWTNLDIPYSGTNYVRATNWVKVSLVYANGTSNPPVQMRMTEINTAWPFRWGGTTKMFTNTIVTYCSPDN
ncbi:MAG: type II secretion system protein [Verrucomicrobiota bacterium]